jgi:hypothetical protein
MVAVKWKDRHGVHMLTTGHCNEMKMTGKKQQKTKPACGKEYNKNCAMLAGVT